MVLGRVFWGEGEERDGRMALSGNVSGLGLVLGLVLVLRLRLGFGLGLRIGLRLRPG